MFEDPLTQSVEDTLTEAMTALSMPLPGECLRCWLRRAVDAFGCDGSYRWARAWSSRRGESWSRRRRWMRGFSAPCDCEVLVHCFGEHFCEEHSLTIRAIDCPDCS